MKKRMLSMMMVIVMIMTVIPIANNSASNTGVNYARLLQYLLYFYDANMCGSDVDTASGITWRGACHTSDMTMSTPYGTMDLSGGFHDAGDHIKFGVTASYATMTMALGYREFKEAFVATGQDEHMEIILKRFAEYLRKCTVLKSDGSLEAYCYQVGDGRDHNYWGQPEEQLPPANRPAPVRQAYFITPDHPGTDQLMAAAGALASNYALFKNPEDLKCALALYNAAKSWDKFARGDARDQDAFYRRNGPKGGNGDRSKGLWQDFGAAAAMWLHVGTGDSTSSYLTDANNFAAGTTVGTPAQDYWALCWDSVWQIANALRGNANSPGSWSATGAERIRGDMYDVSNTALANPANYVFIHKWGSAVLNAGLQFTGLLHDKFVTTGTYANRYSDWARGQTDYLMGNNPANKCYVTGYGENSVKHTHHSGASGYTTQPGTNETRPQKNLLIGALAGGPIDAQGNHNDFEDDYEGNEVGITYNAPFIGAVAGLYLKYGNDSMKPDTAIPSVNIIYPKGQTPSTTTAPSTTTTPSSTSVPSAATTFPSLTTTTAPSSTAASSAA
ncbi:MAG: glycoside hydrolase family 9 protein, partial [Oscillospiraceae bacterium]|nr:glycoside hydrolase family 9 protein [Oscillospiraceae bacterium]